MQHTTRVTTSTDRNGSGDHHATPATFATKVQALLGTFTLDVAASKANAKAPTYLGPDHTVPSRQDGLAADWETLTSHSHGLGIGSGVIWCNPPYGRGSKAKGIAGVDAWLAKCATTATTNPSRTVVALVRSSTGTVWFRDAIASGARPVFVTGRLRFGGQKDAAPFDSLLLVWNAPANVDLSTLGVAL